MPQSYDGKPKEGQGTALYSSSTFSLLHILRGRFGTSSTVFYPTILVSPAPDINWSNSVVKGDALLDDFPSINFAAVPPGPCTYQLLPYPS